MKRLLNPLLSLALVGTTVVVLSSCSPKEETASDSSGDHKAITTEKLEPYECGTVSRLHTFDGIFLASQPQPDDFEQAKKGGVRTVINLRHDEENKDFKESEVVNGLGLNYAQVPFNGAEELTDEVFDKSLELLKTAERPILLHCSSANRVGALWIPYRVLEDGLSVEDATAEAKIVGLKSPDYEKRALEYIEKAKN